MRISLFLLLCAVSMAPLHVSAQDSPPIVDDAAQMPQTDAAAAEPQDMNATAAPVDVGVPTDGAPVEQPMADGTAEPEVQATPATPIAPITPPTDNPDNILSPQTAMETSLSAQLMYLNPQINVNKMRSLFLSDWEHDLVIDARLGLKTNIAAPVTDTPDSGIRDISLGGIVYKSSKDWAVWLNQTMITPSAIPAEIMDIKVYKEYIEIEWFDRSKNLIYPIRLRAHQRFNLDTRMFLPG